MSPLQLAVLMVLLAAALVVVGGSMALVCEALIRRGERGPQ